MNEMSLLSHPTLLLTQHIEQVNTAATFLFNTHSEKVRTQRSETAAVLTALVRGHDLGKGSPAFQHYIRNPEKYRGDYRAKEHSALSAVLTLLWARQQCLEPLTILALTQAIAGHHAGFATLEYLENRLRLDDDDPLLMQWEQLDYAVLTQASGLELTKIDGEFEDARRWLFRRQDIAEKLHALAIDEAVHFRLWTQFIFSLLLEADKAFLALSQENTQRYLQVTRPTLSSECVDKRITDLATTPLNDLRQQLRSQFIANINSTDRYCTLTLPTGTGKTLLAASWAFAQREQMAQTGVAPRIIIALPFLSIVDQTEKEYRELLGIDVNHSVQSDLLLSSHSLSQREYEWEGEKLGTSYTRFYLDTWRSEIIVTTFDQLLLALLSPRTRHQMRHHVLMDAVIVLDEVQTLPCQLWDIVDHTLRGLTIEGNSRVLLMSATQPALLTGAQELAGNTGQITEIFNQFNRYQLIFWHRDTQCIDDFIAELLPRLDIWQAHGQRVLITLNTRASAKAVWQAVREHLVNTVPVYLITADVTPNDRIVKIDAIKALSIGKPCVVVSTQTIEAGVDIDMDVVIRDFAPLDALIQIAGRCNRNNRLDECGGQVEIISLMNTGGRDYASMIYDTVLLDITREVLAQHPEQLSEKAVLGVGQAYFDLVKARKNTGTEITRAFAYWEEMPDVQTLLRGRIQQISFLVLNAEEKWLLDQLKTALNIADRWERREALRALASELQRRTVTVYARPTFHPEEYAQLVGAFWVLRTGYYHSDSGLDFGDDEESTTCIL